MKEVLEILENNRNGYLATVEGDQPRVRVFQFQYYEDGKFYFVTSNEKSVWKQIKDNPKVEFCIMEQTMFPYIRISGTIGFSDDIKVKERMLEMSPLAKSVFQSADNPAVEAIYIEKGEAVITKSPAEEPVGYKF